jgi:hypothetical protein
VDVEDLGEMLYWTARLGCKSAELRAAVSEVGPNLGAVRKYLAAKRNS